MLRNFRAVGFIILILLFFFPTEHSFAKIQVEEEIIEEESVENIGIKDTINLSYLYNLINSNDTEIVISDYHIISDDNDNNLLIDKVFFNIYEISQETNIPCKLYFYSCTFDLINDSRLAFSGLKTIKFNIVNCEFKAPVIFGESMHIGKYPILVENCLFQDDVKFHGEGVKSNGLNIYKNEFATSLTIEIPTSKIKINNCLFFANEDKFSERDAENNHYQLLIEKSNIDIIELISNDFINNGISNVFSINMEEIKIAELILIKNKLQTINLSYAEVKKSLLIDSLVVDNYIGIQNFDFPASNTNVPWYNIAGEKLSIFYTEESGLIIPYQAKTDEDLADNLKYNDLISAYTKFNSMYHNRGDINSANYSYVEIKDIETRKQAYSQEINPSLNNLINYKLNVFLRFFSDYATNPGKSLILSLWILLIFSLLYMISFSKWDGMNYRYYLNQYYLFTKYITTEDSIDQVYESRKFTENDDIHEFLKKYKLLSRDTPRLLKLFGEPLHFLGKFRYKIIPRLINLFNFHPGTWQSKTSKTQKIWSGLTILTISLLFLLYTLIVKFINSLVLSLNSFIVIGFGTLPEDEEWFAMYLSIIEGIIGWFLLTIFTITLFSQVLQNA
jgi:hypothetical protein